MNKSSMLILFFLTLSLGLAAQSNLDKGNVAYKARNYHDAIANYERASMANPTNPTLLQNLADCYRITNKMDKAARYYKQICQPNTVTPPIHYYRYGLVLQALQKYDLAVKVFDVYAKVNPKKANKAKEACLFAKTHATANTSAFTVSKESINFKGYDNYAPILQPKYLVFTSSTKVPFSAQGGSSNPKSDNYLYKSTLSPSGQLVGQQLVKKPVEVTPPHNLAPFAVNANETFAVSTLNQFSNGVRHISEASLSFLSMEINHKIKNIDYFPVGYDFPYMSNHSASFPALANNGNSIYFAAADYPGGQGGYDIWVIHRQGNSWTRPINLGPNVNTPGDEICPFIANNGKLFFSSDYHKGFGGYDVFQSSNVNGTWKAVKNLGNQVNSSFDDMYFIYDAAKRLGYFSSNRKNDYMNIYRANMTGSDALFLPVNTAEVNAVVAGPPSTTTTTTRPTTTTTTNPPATTTTTTYGSTTSGGTVQQTNSGGFRPKPSTTTKPVVTTNTPVTPTTTNPPAPTVGSKPTVGNGNTVPCAMNFYIGAILDSETKRPVKGAKVFIQNIRSDKGKQIKDPTNMYGEYSVILDPLSDFTIYISKPGYQSLVFDVNTGSGGKKTLLGTRELVASPMSNRDEFGNVVAADPTVVNNNKPTQDELLHPTHSSSKYFSRHSGGQPIPPEGYIIKVFALSKPIPAAQKLKLQEYGNLMTEQRGNLTIYKLGMYADKAHVLNILPEVQKINPEARIVTEKLDNNHLGGVVALSSQLVYPPIKKTSPTLPTRPVNTANNPGSSSGVGNGMTTTETPTIIENDHNSWTNKELPQGVTPRGDMPTPGAKPVIVFKVKVGAFSKPENASFSNISHLGMIEQTKSPKDGLTRFYISSFKTLNAAQAARDKAQEKGILNPSITAFENGKEISLTEALNKL